MSTLDLKSELGREPTRPGLVADCAALIDNQVKAKRGLSGIAIKGAYGTVKAIKRGMVPDVIDALLDDWLDKLQPYYETWSASGATSGFAEYLATRSDEVAEDLLTVTDERAQNSKHKTAAKAYQKMRGSAKTNVVEAVPELARIIENHIAASANA
jgi:hypothetical protein